MATSEDDALDTVEILVSLYREFESIMHTTGHKKGKGSMLKHAFNRHKQELQRLGLHDALIEGEEDEDPVSDEEE